MEFTFANGTSIQIAAVQRAIGMMLDFDFDRFPQTLTFEFSPDPVPEGGGGYSDTEIAATYVDEHRIAIRDDFPRIASSLGGYFGPQFSYDTVVHELGHYFTYLLPPEGRTAVEELMGIPPGSALPTEGYGEGPWEAQGPEAVAEQFKAAFLPGSDPSRATTILPIALWPQFREIYRGSYEIVEGGGDSTAPFLADLWTLGNTEYGLSGSFSEEGGVVLPYRPGTVFSNSYFGKKEDPIPLSPESFITAPDQEWFDYDGNPDADAGGENWNLRMYLSFINGGVAYRYQRELNAQVYYDLTPGDKDSLRVAIYADEVLVYEDITFPAVKGVTWATFDANPAEVLALIPVALAEPNTVQSIAAYATMFTTYTFGHPRDADAIAIEESWGTPSTIVQAYGAGTPIITLVPHMTMEQPEVIPLGDTRGVNDTVNPVTGSATSTGTPSSLSGTQPNIPVSGEPVRPAL